MAAHRIAFRTDASDQIGTGHFMRCLTLADGLKQRGAQIRFVSRHLPEHLRSMLVANDHEFALLDSVQNDVVVDELAHAHWLEVSQAQDAADSIRALSDEAWDWLVIDHYTLDIRWESALRITAKRIMVIDDLADRQHDCDVLLDQNFYADMQTRYISKVPSHCALLMGPRYALLRDEFRQLHEQVKSRNGPVKRILVFFGGVDADNYTGRAIEALSEIVISGMHVDVVIGAQHPCREQIKKASGLNGFICHIQTTKIAELMAIADLAIGAGGSATLERCSMGLPSIILVLAENQKKAAKDLNAAGVLINLGDARSVTKTKLAQAIRELIEDEKLRSELSVASLMLVPLSKQSDVVKIMVGNNV